MELAGICALVALSQPAEAPEEPEPATVTDKPSKAVTEPPLYYQADERWGGLPYATEDGVLATHGCGLTAAAMAASYITGEEITPPVLLNLVGNRCVVDGMNDMGLLCEELHDLYFTESEGPLWTADEAEAHLSDGWMLFGGMQGSVIEGHQSYGGHVLLVWKMDERGVYIRDPDDPTLVGPIGLEEFRATDWSYFYAIREGQA